MNGLQILACLLSYKRLGHTAYKHGDDFKSLVFKYSNNNANENVDAAQGKKLIKRIWLYLPDHSSQRGTKSLHDRKSSLVYRLLDEK